MTVVDTISIIGAVFSIVLAAVAILFTWRVNERNQELNVKFTETLTSINEQTTNTQAAMNHTVNQIVEAFIQTRRDTGPSQLLADVTGEAQPSDDAPQDSLVASVADRLSRMDRLLNDLELRARFQSRDVFSNIHTSQDVTTPTVRQTRAILDGLETDLAVIEWAGATVTISRNDEGEVRRLYGDLPHSPEEIIPYYQVHEILLAKGQL